MQVYTVSFMIVRMYVHTNESILKMYEYKLNESVCGAMGVYLHVKYKRALDNCFREICAVVGLHVSMRFV